MLTGSWVNRHQRRGSRHSFRQQELCLDYEAPETLCSGLSFEGTFRRVRVSGGGGHDGLLASEGVVPYGRSPSGTMTIQPTAKICPGFAPDTTCIEVIYNLPSGMQHTSEGLVPYTGTIPQRVAYLPNNLDGRRLLWRLKFAFSRGLSFSVGTSLTSGATDIVVWTSSFDHKTSLQGGQHGLPDPMYIERCNKQLDALGIVPKSPNEPALEEYEVVSYTSPRNLPLTTRLPDAPTTEGSDRVAVNPSEDCVNEDCSICFESLFQRAAVRVRNCHHVFHQDCITTSLSHNARCPICRKLISNPQGRSPSGRMTIKRLDTTCPGSNNVQVIRITYDIPPGIQKPYHDNPGSPFTGTNRNAYVPNTPEGCRLLTRLQFAWTHGVIFTVGTSLTTRIRDTVTWTSIPHKTSLRVGDPHGFPDPEYIANCDSALDALGVPDADDCLDSQSNRGISDPLEAQLLQTAFVSYVLHTVVRDEESLSKSDQSAGQIEDGMLAHSLTPTPSSDTTTEGKGGVFDTCEDKLSHGKKCSSTGADDYCHLTKTSSVKSALTDDPNGITHEGGFLGSLSFARRKNRLLVVNIQDDARCELDLMAMNREVWQEEAVESLIRTDLVLWRTLSHTPEGQTFVELYNVCDYPHVSILEPVTGRLLWRWEGWTKECPFTASVLVNKVADYLSSKPSASALPSGQAELIFRDLPVLSETYSLIRDSCEFGSTHLVIQDVILPLFCWISAKSAPLMPAALTALRRLTSTKDDFLKPEDAYLRVPETTTKDIVELELPCGIVFALFSLGLWSRTKATTEVRDVLLLVQSLVQSASKVNASALDACGQFVTNAIARTSVHWYEDLGAVKEAYAVENSVGAGLDILSVSLAAVTDRATWSNSIAFLISEPLVIYDDHNNVHPLGKLAFGRERKMVWKCLEKAKRNIELTFDAATHKSLLTALTKGCRCLHYSGHGCRDMLFFERRGSAVPFPKTMLQRLVANEAGSTFQLVFISACQSFTVGQALASAGVKHVVCCNENAEIKDEAALAFTDGFYFALASGTSVKIAFEQGQKSVQFSPEIRDPEAEMHKFVLLGSGDHNEAIFESAESVPEWPIGGTASSILRSRNKIQEQPSLSPPRNFLGRDVDFYKVQVSVLEKGLVNIFGDAGIGCTSLARALCHRVNEHASTMPFEHIYFAEAQSQDTDKSSLLYRLLHQLHETNRIAELPGSGSDFGSMASAACKALSGSDALVVLDDVHLISDGNGDVEFGRFLCNLSNEVTVLVTSRNRLGLIRAHEVKLRPLSFGNTVRLFARSLPSQYTLRQRHNLVNALVIDQSVDDAKIADPSLSDAIRRKFELLGSGVPSLIEQAAHSISCDDFSDLMTKL